MILLLVFTVLSMAYPFIWTRANTQFRFGPSKVAALVVGVLSLWIYDAPSFFAYGPIALSLIWFPEFWAQYQGFIWGGYVSEKSPPIVIAFVGWLFLIPPPLTIHWVPNLKL